MAVKTEHLVTTGLLVAITAQVVNNFGRYTSVPNKREIIVDRTLKTIKNKGAHS